MNKILKYLVIGLAAISVIVVGVIVAVPLLIDVNKYKPEIEKLVAQQTGYQLNLAGDVQLSLVPVTELAFEDLTLQSPQGFEQKEFIKIKRFRAGLNPLSVLKGNVEVTTFNVESPEIILERNKQGRWNWQELAGDKDVSAPVKESKKENNTFAKATKGVDTSSLPIKSLAVGDFKVFGGRILVDDKQGEMSRELSDFTLQLTDVSLDKPVIVDSSWTLDGQPFAIKGTVGPVGSKPGVDPLAFALNVSALNLSNAVVAGRVNNLTTDPAYDLTIDLPTFDPRKFVQGLGEEFPVQTQDPTAFTALAVKLKAKGTANSLSSSNMTVRLDDTTMNVTGSATNFSQPDLTMNLKIDQLNADRYLPKTDEKESGETVAVAGNNTQKSPQTDTASTRKTGGAPGNKTGTVKKAKPAASGQGAVAEPIDYTPLRKLVLSFRGNLNNVQIHGGKIDTIALVMEGKDGLFQIRNAEIDLYEGKLLTTGTVNVQGKIPKVTLDNQTNGILIGPLLQDFMQKDILEGAAKAQLNLKFAGTQSEMIKSTLNGDGLLELTDGAVVGLDLAQLAREIKSGFTLEQQGERPKTDFAELRIPFILTNGVFNTTATSLKSPFLRVGAEGNANLVQETLNMKVEPKIVESSKGQGAKEESAGIAIPVLVTGSFQQPEFTPDLEGLVKDEIPDADEIKTIIETGEIPEDTKQKIEEGKKLLKGLFGN